MSPDTLPCIAAAAPFAAAAGRGPPGAELGFAWLAASSLPRAVIAPDEEKGRDGDFFALVIMFRRSGGTTVSRSRNVELASAHICGVGGIVAPVVGCTSWRALSSLSACSALATSALWLGA